MPTVKQKKAFTLYYENLGSSRPIPLGQVLIQAGYSITQSKQPQQVTKSKGWQELLDEALPDDLLSKTHQELLQSTKLGHEVFPVYTGEPDDDKDKPVQGATLTDDDIRQMFKDINCLVRRIVHGETARHVYFWMPDAKARSDALKLAYDVKGKLNKRSGEGEQSPITNNYNTFVQQNNINPNTPSAQELVQNTLSSLMEQTKWKPQEPVEGEVVDKQ